MTVAPESQEWAIVPIDVSIGGRAGIDRLIGRNRRFRALLLDVLRYLERPGPPERELARRCSLAERIREAVGE